MKSFMKILESVEEVTESIEEMAKLNSIQREDLSNIIDCVTTQFPNATLKDVEIISPENIADEVLIKFNCQETDDNLQQLDSAMYAAVDEKHKELQEANLITELHAEWGDRGNENTILIKGFLYKTYDIDELKTHG